MQGIHSDDMERAAASLDENIISIKDLSAKAGGHQAYIRFGIPKSLFSPEEVSQWKPHGEVCPPKFASKLVVVKHLTDYGHSLPLRRKDFEDELKALRAINQYRGTSIYGMQLHHFPNLLQQDTSPEPLWFAMEIVPGSTVRDWQSRRRQTWDGVPRVMVYHIFVQVLEAIRWLYEPGPSKLWYMEHCDLHPGNLMLDATKARPLGSNEAPDWWHLPQVVVIDFGSSIIKPVISDNQKPTEVDEEAGDHDAMFLGEILHNLAHNAEREKCGFGQRCHNARGFLLSDESPLDAKVAALHREGL